MPVPVPLDEDSDTASDDESEYPASYPGAEQIDSEFEELQPDDFPTYFSERNGRLFHSHGGSPYPLPVDTPELERMNVSHLALFELIGGHYPSSCPVSDVLLEEPGRQKFALDLCTGTGKWAMDVAYDFPHVAFRGIDIVPIATQFPLPNVQFTMHDVNTPTTWAAGTFDLIHGRSITMAVTSYPTLLIEVVRLLRPRGLLLSGEWGRYPSFHPSFAPRTPATHAPALSAFYAHLYTALAQRRLLPITPPVAPLLAQTHAFTDIVADEFYMPIGAWHPDPAMRQLGRVFRVVFLRYIASVRPMLAESGVATPEALDDMYQRVERELRTVAGLVGVFHTVHARKI
ncbi:S-adenosyl-L-methionine-dependent methyltransferase [Mycena belliarum]|uniref:S-adenosyl-L-methionine-dependent methyltransferase n=1 Tax=Mycena belliarum TaxID=1033014 RepID=A0AAD6U6A2_9AGAR|nr:S-adenosyl-L-methionine-dependent methyltransferase [Mycena belliae]